MPALRQLSGQVHAFRQPDTQKKYEHTTRVAATGGSASGSHPAWDPV